MPEWAYGVTDWLKLGAYLPLYTLTNQGRLEFDGGKLRTLFVVPHANYRAVSRFYPLSRQDQTVFVVVDYNGEPNSVEFGFGHGFAEGSDALVLKMMITHDF